MSERKMPILQKEGSESNDAGSAVGGYPRCNCSVGRAADPSGLPGGVTDRHEKFLEGLLGVFLAAASAAICAAIDCLTQERKH